MSYTTKVVIKLILRARFYWNSSGLWAISNRQNLYEYTGMSVLYRVHTVHVAVFVVFCGGFKAKKPLQTLSPSRN